MKKSPGFIIGNIAKGKDFWDREQELAALRKSLESTSVLLKAPRRFGKTSIMYELYENPSPGYTHLFQDTEGMRSPADFISGIMSKALSEQRLRQAVRVTSKWIGNLIDQIEEVGLAEFRLKIRSDLEVDWQDKGRELISLLQAFDETVVFILDELPILVQNIARKHDNDLAIDFLLWFRSLRQMPELENVRWVLGGSIGIEHILEIIGAGTKTINDLQIMRIGPFSEKDGIDYIKALLRTEVTRVPPAVVDKINKLIGAHVPYFIQILAYESLNEMRRRGRKTLDEEIVETAYYREVLGPATRTYFEHYFTRLQDYYDHDVEKVAKRLLLEIARLDVVDRNALFNLFKLESRGELSDERFSYLMTDLENDFYVVFDPEQNSYGFTTKVLRDWWMRNYDLIEVDR